MSEGPPNPMSAPLAGIRILEVGVMLAGPTVRLPLKRSDWEPEPVMLSRSDVPPGLRPR